MAELYKEHGYVREKLNERRKNNFDQICSGILKDEVKDEVVIEDALVDLSKCLNDFTRTSVSF